MASPLSLLTQHALNAKLPASRDHSFADSTPPNDFGGERKWSKAYSEELSFNEGGSSPFVTEVISEHSRRIASSEVPQASPKSGAEPGLPKDHGYAGDDSAEPPCVAQHNVDDEMDVDAINFNSSPVRMALNKHFDGAGILDESAVTRDDQVASTMVTEPSETGNMTSLMFSDDATIDDTCFSTFSEVPNTDMTAFARLGQSSPFKPSLLDQSTPRPLSRLLPGISRNLGSPTSPLSASSTPKRNQAHSSVPENDTTSLLIDFTQQFEAFSSQSQSLNYQQQAWTPARRSPSKGGHLLSAYLQSQRSPAKGAQNPSTPIGPKQSLLNLLDIELPPAPTPRSVPSITIRELESLKSDFASQVSSLKATLSGREAEVEALKRAVGDAERRVGEAVESAREEKAKAEYVEKQKEEWERRGREFEEILKKVRREVFAAEKDRTDVEARLREAEERIHEAEARAEEAESRAVEASTKVVTVNAEVDSNIAGYDGPLFTAEQVQKQIDEKIHVLSNELHAIYKKKHVTKVSGLKKGFEAKTKEKTAELQSKIDELEQRNEDLQATVDGTLSGVVNMPAATFGTGLSAQEREEELERMKEQAALIEAQKAELFGKESELRTAHAEFSSLMKELEQERIEKSELVAAVDEMLALQVDASTIAPAAATSAVEDFRKSVGIGGPRPTGLARPGFGMATPGPASRIGMPTPMRGAQGGGKSKMMSNIERMGGGRGL